MNRKFKAVIFIVLLFLQFLIHRYMNVMSLNLDLLYLILVFISVKSGFMKTIFSATAIGLVTDYFSMNVMGVFGFSRTLAAYFLNQTASHIDLKNNVFVFFFISGSLCISNLIANVFFYFTSEVSINLNLVIYQPVLTGLMGIMILSSARNRQHLDVY
ncbi:MAG: rod shape-determining protein MreD [bacterium]|nr:rod shape-determining protein MreD [bacterium]